MTAAITDMAQFEKLTEIDWVNKAYFSPVQEQKDDDIRNLLNPFFDSVEKKEYIEVLSKIFGFPPQSETEEAQAYLSDDCVLWGFDSPNFKFIFALGFNEFQECSRIEYTLPKNYTHEDVDFMLGYLLDTIKAKINLHG